MKDIYERLARNSQQTKSSQRAKVAFLKEDLKLLAIMTNMSEKVDCLWKKQFESCMLCGMVGHKADFCINIANEEEHNETVNYMGVQGE